MGDRELSWTHLRPLPGDAITHCQMREKAGRCSERVGFRCAVLRHGEDIPHCAHPVLLRERVIRALGAAHRASRPGRRRDVDLASAVHLRSPGHLRRLPFLAAPGGARRAGRPAASGRRARALHANSSAGGGPAFPSCLHLGQNG